jgi:hypothetical protein
LFIQGNLTEAYKSLSEALLHAGIHTKTKVNIHYFDSEEIEEKGVGCLSEMSAILVAIKPLTATYRLLLDSYIYLPWQYQQQPQVNKVC